MKKFTKLQQEPQGPALDQTVQWDGGHMQILKVEEWDVLQEKDMVIALPYITAYNQIMVRAEHVPPYTLRNPGQSKFMTVMSGQVEDGEEPLDALRRELTEECGIVLRDAYQPDKVAELMVFKGGTAKYHIYILPLKERDYTQVPIKGDGTQSEARSSCVYVPINKFKGLKAVDVVTAYVLEMFNKEYKLY